MKKNEQQLMQERLIEATRTVRQYAGSDASNAVIEMLDGLARSYLIDLVNVDVTGLVKLQAAIQQVYALRNVLANDGLDIPKI
jgi:hypothetical protein